MKKILLFSLIAILALGSVQAQKKTKRLSPAAAKGQKEIPAAVELKSEPILLPDAIEGLELPLFDALKLRCTYREFTEEELSLELISSLLWSAYGFNRPEEGKRVAPSAVNVQEFDIYLFTREGIYIYDAAKNTIQMVVQGDHRAEISNQKHFAVAPVSLLIVANYQRMSIFKDKVLLITGRLGQTRHRGLRRYRTRPSPQTPRHHQRQSPSGSPCRIP